MGGYEDAYERDGDTRWLKVEMGGAGKPVLYQPG